MGVLKGFIKFLVVFLSLYSSLLVILLLYGSLVDSVSVGAVGGLGLSDFLFPLFFLLSAFYFNKAKQRYLVGISLLGVIARLALLFYPR